MADDRVDELQALGRVIEACRVQAGDLDMPALTYILRKAELSVLAHVANAAPPRRPAPSVPRGRLGRH